MPNWNELLNRVQSVGGPADVVRRQCLTDLQNITGRNVIIYYSGWLQKLDANVQLLSINDDDKNGFMTTINKLDRSKGLDLVLHTPGGDLAAAESLVDYLKSMFKTDIRAIIPQMAMSCGTMIACACKTILMGRESSLGPIDPQFGGVPASGIIEEFQRAEKEVTDNPALISIWQPIIAKYSPTLIGECEKAMHWSKDLVRQWLLSGMFEADADSDERVNEIVEALADHASTLSHARHLSPAKCKEIGLKVEMFEDNQKLQDAILSVHHACILTLTQTMACKIIENHLGTAFIKILAPTPLVTKV